MSTSSRPSAQLSPTERIVQRVAERVDRDPLDLPPLYEAVDPDALNVLIDGLDSGSVTFEYVDELVTVRSDGTVEVGVTVEQAATAARPQD